MSEKKKPTALRQLSEFEPLFAVAVHSRSEVCERYRLREKRAKPGPSIPTRLGPYRTIGPYVSCDPRHAKDDCEKQVCENEQDAHEKDFEGLPGERAPELDAGLGWIIEVASGSPPQETLSERCFHEDHGRPPRADSIF